MARRSKVVTLPPEVKAWLDAALVEGAFSGYELLSAELKSRGYEVSKSALHRYGEPFERLMAKVKASGEQAKALMAAAGDDKGAMNDALIRTIQTKTLEVLVADEEGKIAGDPKVMRAVATLVRSSVMQKEWADKLQKRLDAEMDKAESALAEGQNPRDVLAAIRAAYQGAL